ncbi:unnamed protein product, partial [Ectocarpus sp. 12 AP-2014]
QHKQRRALGREGDRAKGNDGIGWRLSAGGVPFQGTRRNGRAFRRPGQRDPGPGVAGDPGGGRDDGRAVGRDPLLRRRHGLRPGAADLPNARGGGRRV